ncbi:MAG: hypothetical protein ABIR04_03725 [Cypionkella sp.]
MGKIASSLADASDALRDKDLGEILQAASRVARDNPVLFLSGAALLGFAASRFAKASSEQSIRTDSSQTSQMQNAAAEENGALALRGGVAHDELQQEGPQT